MGNIPHSKLCLFSYYSLLKDIRIKDIPYSCLLKGVWVEKTKYSWNIDYILTKYDQILIKYDQILTKYDKNDQIHIENIQERHFLGIKKTT